MGVLMNLAIFVVAVGVGAWFLSQAAQSLAWPASQDTAASNSLKESELRGMIEESVEAVVEEKVSRLERKIDNIENRLGEG